MWEWALGRGTTDVAAVCVEAVGMTDREQHPARIKAGTVREGRMQSISRGKRVQRSMDSERAWGAGRKLRQGPTLTLGRPSVVPWPV